MQCPLSRRTYLLTILLFCLVFIAFFFYSMHQLPPPRKYMGKNSRPVDTATLVLNGSMAKDLKKEHKLDYIKSRGATIFIDKDDVIRVPPNYILDLMEFRDLEETYDRYLGSIQIICKRTVHLGDVTEGGYDVCEDVKVRPLRPCIVYSFSSSGEYTFEETLASMYECEVHVFISGADEEAAQQSSSLHFHDISLGDTESVKRTAIARIKKELHHEKPVSMIKLDINGEEWSALAQMLAGVVFQEVDQLIVKFHSLLDQSSRSVDHRNKLDYRKHLSVLGAVYDKGFRIFYHRRVTGRACVFVDDFNITRTGCHEVSMMKVK